MYKVVVVFDVFDAYVCRGMRLNEIEVGAY